MHCFCGMMPTYGAITATFTLRVDADVNIELSQTERRINNGTEQETHTGQRRNPARLFAAAAHIEYTAVTRYRLLSLRHDRDYDATLRCRRLYEDYVTLRCHCCLPPVVTRAISLRRLMLMRRALRLSPSPTSSAACARALMPRAFHGVYEREMAQPCARRLQLWQAINERVY